MKTLSTILKECKEISDYKLVNTITSSCELFFVSDKLETSRTEDINETEVTIYVDKDEKRGDATFSIYPYMDEQDIKNKIKENVNNCMFSLNKHFDLVKPNEEEVVSNSTNLSQMSLKEAATKVAKAVFKADTSKELTLNATEVFVYKIDKHIVNSLGVDVSSTLYKINVELIPTYNGQDESVEVYFMLRAGELDKEAITREVNNQLNLVKARKFAQVKKIDQPLRILIEESENIVEGVVSYFAQDLNYAMIYQHMNRQNVGDNIQGDVKGDKLNISLCPIVPGVCNSIGIDNDGIKLHEIQIIKDGKAINSFGSNKFGQYLNVEHPTGDLPVIKVEAGSLTDKELKTKPYLRCIKFSSIQLEPNSGFFGGEVRLGFYFDGEKEIPVTGFTISGCMHEEKSTLRMSEELIKGSDYYGPKFFAFEGMKIN